MWRKLTLALVVVPLGVILVALAVVNRKPVELVLDPFGGAAPNFSLQAPLFLLLLGAFAVGLDRRRHRHLARPRQMAARGAGGDAPSARLAPPGRPAGEGA